MCIIASDSLGLLFLGLVSRACLTCLSALVVYKWQWCDWTNMEITTQLARELGYQLATICDIWSSNRHQMNSSGIVKLVHMEKLTTSWRHISLSHVITCDMV